MHQLAVPGAATRSPRPRALSVNDLYEIVAISVLGPASWLVPHRLWDFVSVALSSGIALLRPDVTLRRMRRLERGLAEHPTGSPRSGSGYASWPATWRSGYRSSAVPAGRLAWPHRDIRYGAPGALKARGRGVVLWVCPFTYADLIVKTALARAGLEVSHLSACSRGFSPNACHPWTPTRFGKRYLSRLRTAVEDRYLHERVIMPRDGSLGYIRRLERLLKSGGVLSMRAGKVGYRTMDLPMLGGLVTLATGAPSLAIATGAALVPVFVARRGPGRFEVIFEPPLEPAADGAGPSAVPDLMRRYTRLLEDHVLRSPTWSGWYYLRFPDRA